MGMMLADPAGNYLRVRGEYPWNIPPAIYWPELPPRARRILAGAQLLRKGKGTTSACAENTRLARHRPVRWGNYLRVRGEYPTCLVRDRNIPELPPRARRIPGRPYLQYRISGTTSACAENTRSAPCPGP